MITDNEVLIKVEDLRKSFGDIDVLKGMNTEIRKGEVVVIIGPSGSGKSTFLRTLNLLEMPTGGKIYFEGVNIADPNININRHRQKMGMVHCLSFALSRLVRRLPCLPTRLFVLILQIYLHISKKSSTFAVAKVKNGK